MTPGTACGTWSQAGVGFAFGQGITEGDICAAPALGAHDLVVASQDSHLDGVIQLWGHYAKENGTAPA